MPSPLTDQVMATIFAIEACLFAISVAVWGIWKLCRAPVSVSRPQREPPTPDAPGAVAPARRHPE